MPKSSPDPAFAKLFLISSLGALVSAVAWGAESKNQSQPAASGQSGYTEGLSEEANAPTGNLRQSAPPPSTQLNGVEIHGKLSDDERRQQATASKIIIGRDEIDRYGDTSAVDILKRLPGITIGGRPGRGSGIQMRGMGAGYTQILVNGERMPPGFSIEDLPPSQIERIEILRAPTAEYGTRAIAGTINIVLREALPRRVNDVNVGLTTERGIVNPRLTWVRNDKIDDHSGATYNLSVTAAHNSRRDDGESTTLTQDLTTGAVSELHSFTASAGASDSINATGRLQLKRGEDTLVIQPFIMLSRASSTSMLHQAQTVASALPSPYPFDEATTQNGNRLGMVRLQLQWTTRLDDATKIEARGSLGRALTHSNSKREELSSALFFRNEIDHTDAGNTSWNLASKLSHTIGDQHSLVAGVEGEGAERIQVRNCMQSYVVGAAPTQCTFLAGIGDNANTASKRYAAYAQDDWSVGDFWAFYAGWRWESIRTESTDAPSSIVNTTSVATPLLHALYKIDGKGREQIRASITRSFRPPDVSELGGRLAISSLYPCGDPARPCATNEVSASNMLPRGYATGSSSITDTRYIRSINNGRTYTVLQLALELKV